jgi:hypothetical protein
VTVELRARRERMLAVRESRVVGVPGSRVLGVMLEAVVVQARAECRAELVGSPEAAGVVLPLEARRARPGFRLWRRSARPFRPTPSDARMCVAASWHPRATVHGATRTRATIPGKPTIP